MSPVVIRSLVSAVCLSLASSTFAAAPTLNRLFSDHMVLQQSTTVPVWGWADPGDKITVRFGDQTVSTVTNEDGEWRADFAPLEASSKPALLRVTSNAYDGVITISDVLVGEVWLGSGQSNMAMTVNRAQDFETEKAAADLPLIRVFKEGSIAATEAQTNPKGDWKLCTPDTVGGFSATAFFMGRELHTQLDVPVGIIVSAVGGTPIENWIDADAQKAVPELTEFTTTLVNATRNFDEAAATAKYEQQKDAWKERVKKAKAAGQAAPRAPRDPVAQHRSKGGPGDLFNGKIAPLVPYAIRGAIWYQGEANSRPGKSELYVHHMPTLIQEWRKLWDDEFPFGIVQLPNFIRDGEGWSEVQEAMLKTAQTVPNTGLAITIDVGDPKDIHPKNKQAVGYRLAQWALGEVYQKDVPASMGPVPGKTRIIGNTVTVAFEHAESGLMAKDGDLTGFEIADADGQWHPANATINGSTVAVSSSAVTQPTAVRYAWTANPNASLYNKAGLPASPFRTR